MSLLSNVGILYTHLIKSLHLIYRASIKHIKASYIFLPFVSKVPRGHAFRGKSLLVLCLSAP